VPTPLTTLPALALLLSAVPLPCRGQAPPRASSVAAIDGEFSVDGRRLYLRCTAGAAPTVLVDAGLGESSDSWRQIQDALPAGIALCVFDRAGYGRSEAGPLPRTQQRNARELHAAAAAAGLRGPFVLVGHSLGGLNALAFVAEYRNSVAGLVLLDPPPRAWLEQQRPADTWQMFLDASRDLDAQATAAERDADPAARAPARQLRAMASEHRSVIDEGAATYARLGTLGEIPTIVLAAERPNPAFGDSAPAFQRLWIAENRRLAGLSRRGELRLLSGRGHSMNREAPAEVVTAIRDMVSLLRGDATRP